MPATAPKSNPALEEAIATLATVALYVEQLRELAGVRGHPFLEPMLARDVLIIRFLSDDLKRVREVL
jgi:hypothetical protein